LAPALDPYLLTGQPYRGPAANAPQSFVSGQINNVTTNVLRAELAPGLVGIYQVYLNLGASLTTDNAAELYIAQNDFRSNVVTVPVFATPVLSSITCDPSTVTGGDTTTCTVLLTVAVPTGLTTVSLSSTDQVNFPVPSSVTVPAGTTAVAFTVTVGDIGFTEDVTVTATLTTTVGTLTSTETITLNPS